MDADSRYLILYAMGDDAFDVSRSEETFAAFFNVHAIVPMVTRKAHPYFLRRQLDAGMVRPKLYRVFATHEQALYGETALASFRVRGPVNGRATVERAEVHPWERRRGIASRVYDIIEDDLRKVGAELWPSAPVSMSDGAFLLWWQRRPDLVVYYPHRERLNLPLTADQHTALTKLDNIDMLVKTRFAGASASVWPKLKTAAELWIRKIRGK
jgi:hypothetical protein